MGVFTNLITAAEADLAALEAKFPGITKVIQSRETALLAKLEAVLVPYGTQLSLTVLSLAGVTPLPTSAVLAGLVQTGLENAVTAVTAAATAAPAPPAGTAKP